MATNTMIDKQDLVDAETIWEYMKLNHTVVKVALNALQHTYMYRASVHPHKMNPTVAIVKSDLILCLCSYDIRVAEKAASLWHDGLANVILFSGNSGKLTEGLWNKPEADMFRERALELKVPASKILVENKSTNTGENIKFSYSVLTDNSLLPRSLILVQKPYMERRAYATFIKQWPGETANMNVMVTSPDIDLLTYPNETVGDLSDVISVMVGDMARIKLYESKGFQIAQPVPDKVHLAYQRLKQSGNYNSHMPY